MSLKDIIIQELEIIPADYLPDVLGFIRMIEAKALNEGLATAIASETSLKKDWLKPEEDEAWQDL
ncbi:MAG: DUF2281 domain-containing protein [Nitrospirae bacterium]|uniref:hypothetical protein n=1 Tax=Candidatus Magnetobacterium casense TaxID=1455061 RepID=UPI00059079F6|nr:hypothetical protein [Candidatus Magnetobacterium casensis]MBF0338182.1 DUF2281 domain-containing protein [Nitrospirota bacterium]